MIQSDDYNFNTSDIDIAIEQENNIPIPEWANIALLGMYDPTYREMSAMQYDIRRFVGWLNRIWNGRKQ